MGKICVVCGKTYQSNAQHAKYCSKVCANHSRYNRTREEQREQIELDRLVITELYQRGLNDREISKKTGISNSKVRNLRCDLNLPKQMTKSQREVFKLREQGLSNYEISVKTGMDPGTTAQIAIRVGMPYTDEEKKRSLELAHIAQTKPYADEEKFFNEHHPEWEYISGHHGGNGIMTIRHKQCGSVVEKSAVTIRHKGILQCPVCEEEKRQVAEQLRAEQLEQRRQEKIDRFWKQDFKQFSLTFTKCEECGLFFIGRSKFCSEDCRKKRINRRHDKRIKKEAVVDSDITLSKLFDRDDGICWICGGKCDYNDFHKDEGGFFVVGKNYPSIDHVYPLSKGGVHSWDNVKLAHHYCNTVKNDKVVQQ